MTEMTAWMPSSLQLQRLALQRARSRIDPARIGVYETRPDKASRDTGYVVIDPGPTVEEVTRGHGRTTSGSGRFSARCYGSSPTQAALVMDEVTACFRDWQPYPDRPRFGAVIRDSADEIGIDKSAPTDPRWLFLLSYELPDD